MAVPRLLSARFTEALTGASELHACQQRKGSDPPISYVAHLLGVASIALEYGATEVEAIAALLHDAIEDAPKDLGPAWVRTWIKSRFGPDVLAIVEGCTDTDQVPKPPWRLRKEAYITHLADASRSMLLVSASDKLHNARAILRDFKQVGHAVWARFKATPDPKAQATIGYYRGLVDAFRARGEHRALIDELESVTTTIEHATNIRGRWPLDP
jgi:(p)ppGpp synthase/HD superfamily hydrolase